MASHASHAHHASHASHGSHAHHASHGSRASHAHHASHGSEASASESHAIYRQAVVTKLQTVVSGNRGVLLFVRDLWVSESDRLELRLGLVAESEEQFREPRMLRFLDMHSEIKMDRPVTVCPSVDRNHMLKDFRFYNAPTIEYLLRFLHLWLQDP